jgi:hypothetical protein
MAANALSGLRFVFDLVGLISEAPSGILLFHMKKTPRHLCPSCRMAANALSDLRFAFDLVGLISEAPSGILLFHMKTPRHLCRGVF